MLGAWVWGAISRKVGVWYKQKIHDIYVNSSMLIFLDKEKLMMYQNYGLIYPYRFVRKKTCTIGSLFFHIIVLVQMLESKKKLTKFSHYNLY